MPCLFAIADYIAPDTEPYHRSNAINFVLSIPRTGKSSKLK
nr:hypothetical protein [Nostoc sp. ChiSLP03a]MDZ8216170.1 hypothetical protein [Nostoc sp. ChiSLP03a]